MATYYNVVRHLAEYIPEWDGTRIGCVFSEFEPIMVCVSLIEASE